MRRSSGLLMLVGTPLAYDTNYILHISVSNLDGVNTYKYLLSLNVEFNEIPGSSC